MDGGDFSFDYFISRRGTAAGLAKEAADVLEAAGYKVRVQDYDFAASGQFVGDIDDALKQCRHLLILHTADYHDSFWTRSEFHNFLAAVAVSDGRRRIGVLRCDSGVPGGLLHSATFGDLFSEDDRAKRRDIILAVAEGRAPASRPVPRLFGGAMPLENRLFTGRGALLADLHAALSVVDGTAALTQAAVHGLGGVGKTSLAREYVARHGDGFDSVWWIIAADRLGTMAGLAELARAMDPRLPPDTPTEQAAMGALREIEKRRGRFLLVYDNAPGPEALTGLLPARGASVLVTSRNPDWVRSAAALPVAEMPLDEAVALLQRRAGREDAAGAGRLARELGCLPLALDQAAAYAKATRCGFDDYTRRVEALIRRPNPNPDYPQIVAATFETAIHGGAAVRPSNLQAEQGLLGALLANNKAYERVSTIVAPEHFADRIHGRIYQALARRIEAGQLADAVTLKAELEYAGILDEVGGTAYLTHLLTAMVGVASAGDCARAIYDAWQRRQLIDRYTTMASAESDAAGSRWAVKDDQFAIDRATKQTDRNAATDPLRQQLQAAICDAAAELADIAGRISNSRTWGRVSLTAKLMHSLLAADPLTLPSRLGEIYAAMLRLGRFLETDIRVQRDTASLDDPLAPDIHGLLTDVVQMAAPWLRGFPTVAAWDDEAGKALVRADLFQPARDFTRIAREQQIISEQDSAEIEMLAETADEQDYQGQKAGNRAVGSAKNLLLATAGTVAVFLSGAVSSDFATRSLLVQRAGATLAAAEAQVEAIAANLPNDLRHALEALVKEGRWLSKL
nr:DnaB-like helicase N-terminal domain-containing protein [uncultured Rhodopila sp.]